MDVPILVFNSNEEDVKAEARLDIGDSVSNNFHQVVKDSLEDNAILRQEDLIGSRAIDSPSISASMVGETKEEVHCSMVNDVGNFVDVRHSDSTVGPVADSKLSNSFEVEDTVLAVSNKDKEKKTHESINNMLALVVKSGKFTLRYETVLKLLRKSEGKLIIIRTIARPLRKSEIEYYMMLSKVGDSGFPLEGN
ncbi:hypothetical protein Vadar_007312 [Vaccinium darrowii]|uniref:Uncharacterized protein n=1 Tax=Vaccinium darrowii TaxID=229202 RepID=A0ACB7WZ54_9ERIC|nr:hypothetical protein Vadar_007312 [Vaccinium darrowii]